MSDHIPEAKKMVCPHCQAGVLIMDNGKQCRAASGAWVTFACLTSIHQGHDPRMSQSRECEEAERNRWITEVATLRTANKALEEQLAAYKAVVEDPAALWANWLRKTVKLPAGIGDVRQLEERVKRLEAWGDRLEELLGDPPDANCSCHISPPCNDCVEWWAIREAKTEWSQAKEAKPDSATRTSQGS